MQKAVFLVGAMLLLATNFSFGQTLDLDKMDVLLHDTLISKTDFLTNGKALPASRLEHLTFAPPTDGVKTVYYLNGARYAQGEIQKGKETGMWTYWHRNGQKAREGSFLKGQREGTHTYWYANGQIRGVGGFKRDVYEGTWTMYDENGVQQSTQTFQAGKRIK
jgi:hypothetical protein